MELSSDLISQFVKSTNDSGTKQSEIIVYGEVVTDGDRNYVQLDGSSALAPIESTVEINPGDRVIVAVKNHSAMVTGNTDDPAIGTRTANGMKASIKNLGDKLEFEVSNEEGSLASKITMVSDRIDSEVLDENNGLASKITQLANKIESEVLDEETGLASKITQNADAIETLVDNDDEFTKFKQTVEGFLFEDDEGTVKIDGGCVELSGAITFDDIGGSLSLSDLSDGETVAVNITNAGAMASQALSDASTAFRSVRNLLHPQLNADGTVKTDPITGSIVYSTYIDGNMIYSDSIFADKIHLGGLLTVYNGITSDVVGGYLGYDAGFNSDSGIGVRDSTGNQQMVCTNAAARISAGNPIYNAYTNPNPVYSQFVASSSGSAHIKGSNYIMLGLDGYDLVVLANHTDYYAFRPYSKSVSTTLGNTSYKWSAVYTDTCTGTTSDRNKKNSIEDLPEKYIVMFDKLAPKRFKLNNGTSDRYHIGYIAQEVEDAMSSSGIDSQEFGGFIKDTDEDGNDIYMLRYGEFDGIRDAKIKQLEARLEKLEKLLLQQ